MTVRARLALLHLQRLQFGAASASCSVSRLHQSASARWQSYENERHFEPGEDVMKRVKYGLLYDFKRWKRRWLAARKDAFKRLNPVQYVHSDVLDYEVWPYRAEIVIIGGGLAGSSAAFWLKERFRDEDLKIVVVEDPDKFDTSTTMLATGAISQQYSLPENIEMAQFTAEFLRHSGHHLRILDNVKPDVHLLPCGFMYLARNDEEAEKLRASWRLQTDKGVRVALWSRAELSERFPDMNFDDVILGTYGLENEGTIDPWQLLSALREKNLTIGVTYIKGTVEGFEWVRRPETPDEHGFVADDEAADEEKWRSHRIVGLYVRPKNTDASARPIRTRLILNAAGPWASDIAKLAGIGSGKGVLAVPLPIEKRKRYVFVLHVPDAPAQLPFLVDPSGVWLRQDDVGQTFLCGKSPTQEEDAAIDHSNLNVDYDFFYDKIWPVLAARVPAFKDVKVKNAWAQWADVNTFDSAPVIGEHPLYTNIHMMCGFGENNVAHTIAAARGYAEKVYENAYLSINLRKFDMRRIIQMNPLEEAQGLAPRRVVPRQSQAASAEAAA